LGGTGGFTGTGGFGGTGGTTGTGSETTIGQYVISADGFVVADTSTGLVWQRGTGPELNWNEAEAYCAGLTLDDSGWRLPTLKELMSIVDTTVANPQPCYPTPTSTVAPPWPLCVPTINQTAFPNTPTNFYWTSTCSPCDSSGGDAWGVDFVIASPYNLYVGWYYGVRCVR
jgi:hypothetical protein